MILVSVKLRLQAYLSYQENSNSGFDTAHCLLQIINFTAISGTFRVIAAYEFIASKAGCSGACPNAKDSFVGFYYHAIQPTH